MRCISLTLFVLFALLCGHSSHAADVKRPNILFIYTDDHSYRTLSCYEHAESWARTPNIDRLAARGVRFTHAYIGTWCMPSRVTMLTGLHQYGALTMRMEGEYPGSEYDPAQCPFWPAVFRRHGYHTAQIGKWHSGRDAGFGRDWDYQIVWNRPKHPANAANYYHDQLLSIDGGEPTVVPGYSTDNYTRWAIDYINGAHRDAGKPWYLWLCYGGVHAPYQPAERHLKDYEGATVAAPADIYPPRPGKPAYMQKVSAWEKGPTGEPVLSTQALGSEVGDDVERDKGRTLSQWSRQYHQAVRALDEGIGQVLAALEESGQLANTLVVLTADQGYAWGQHGFRAKLAPYDANIRSPLIISMPGTIPEGKVCRHPIGGADLPPTFFSFANLELPWPMHGHDLTPLLKNPDAAWPHTTLMPFTADKFGADCDRVPSPPGNRHKSGIPWYLMVAAGRYKYVRTLEAGEPEELYDLLADPDELTNLALQPQHVSTVKKLRTAALAELRRTGAKMVDSLPPVKEEQSTGAQGVTVSPLAGLSLAGWTTPTGGPVTQGWQASRGEIRLDRQSGRGGHIVTQQEFGDFDLSFEWKIAPRGNSGLKYRVRAYGDQVLGCEYQICDEPEGRSLNKRSAGALYDLYEPNSERLLKPAGEWNQARIVVIGQRIEHWLNGRLIVSANVGDEEWNQRIAASKFSHLPEFGQNRMGRIMLTDHGSDVSYRNFVFRHRH